MADARPRPDTTAPRVLTSAARANAPPAGGSINLNGGNAPTKQGSCP